jgi:hypothetical protein
MLYITDLEHHRAVSVSEYTCQELNDNLIEQGLLLPRGNVLSAKGGVAISTAASIPIDYFKMTDFFGNHCHLEYVPVTTKIKYSIGTE